jgi:hypothetical protein
MPAGRRLTGLSLSGGVSSMKDRFQTETDEPTRKEKAAAGSSLLQTVRNIRTVLASRWRVLVACSALVWSKLP